MATRTLSALPPTFPASGVAAAIHRAVTAAGADPRPRAWRGGDTRSARPTPPGAATPGGRGRDWPTVRSSQDRPCATLSTLRSFLVESGRPGAVPE